VRRARSLGLTLWNCAARRRFQLGMGRSFLVAFFVGVVIFVALLVILAG
jgi:hypothetical protein